MWYQSKINWSLCDFQIHTTLRLTDHWMLTNSIQKVVPVEEAVVAESNENVSLRSIKFHTTVTAIQLLQVMYLCLPTLCLPKTGKEPLFANFFLKKKFSGKKRLFANFFSWGNEKLFWTWNSTLSTFSRQILFRTSFQSNFIFLFLCLNWI